ncbi:PREDICTED: V-set and immunoglobulin domain-containing protein 4 isoform X2 [Ficedula albicollis]|uniref:V-set and immunoglobulin domain-containing protein 4 isoform X2 n=1 Tax=Ficedula albicollis TaxID=59894 RepID=UPI0003594B0B|nr:PREDICTED: V-set and immunoglobulin domain-containing protein 4 isoform X2 [Ficedula albicollis]
MGMMLRAAVLLSSLLHCSAFLELSGPSEIKGVWKESVTLPCAYVPVEDLVQQTLTWTVVHDKGSSTIFRRDGSGDHILLSEYRGRVSIPKDVPGDVSLLILSLEISDRGTYTCQVTWRDSNNSLIAKEITTNLEVVKVAATKPIIRGAEPGLALPAGASASLSCEASGSPPISYRWFRSGPAGTAELLSSGAQLAWPSLRPSDSGTYFCEAENRAGAGAAQRSDAVQLTVTDLPTTTATVQRNVGTTGGHHSTTARGESSDMEHTVTDLVPTTRGSRMDTAPLGPFTGAGSPRVAPSPLLYGPAAALGGAALGALLAAGLGWWRRRRKEEPLYEVAFRSTAEVARLHTEGEVPAKSLQEEAHCNTEKTTTKDRKSPEYENLVTAMESQYETEGM